MNGYKKPCFRMYSSDYGFHSHVFECDEVSGDLCSCRFLVDGGSWKLCENGKLNDLLGEYKDWQKGEGNRCPHCGIVIEKRK